MGSRVLSPPAVTLATVVALHAGAVLVLIAETRTRLVRGAAEPNPILVFLLQPRARQPEVPTGSAARPAASRPVPAAAAEPARPPAATPAATSTAIDWSAEASASATRQVEADEQRTRQARALAPKPSPIFRARARRPEFHWNYARTHRVEPVPGLGTIIHLSDQCAIALFVIIPFAGGCALEKPPARGDLFDHMHDPEPGPEPWTTH